MRTYSYGFLSVALESLRPVLVVVGGEERENGEWTGLDRQGKGPERNTELHLLQ